MTTTVIDLKAVAKGLEKTRGRWTELAYRSEVGYFTIQRIASDGVNTNAGVQTVVKVMKGLKAMGQL